MSQILLVSGSHDLLTFIVFSNRISTKQRFLLEENEYCLIHHSCVMFQSRKLF